MALITIAAGAGAGLRLSPPASKKGDAIVFRAEMDLAIGLSACPASKCNGGTTGPLAYEVLKSME
jgi:uncharacterized protein